jgi:hypothetical protein
LILSLVAFASSFSVSLCISACWASVGSPVFPISSPTRLGVVPHPMSKSNETPQSSNAKNEQKYHSQDYYQAIKQAFKETTYVVAHESRFDIKKRKSPACTGLSNLRPHPATFATLLFPLTSSDGNPMRPYSFVRLPPHCGHLHRRKALFSRSISARYMGVPSCGHRTLGTMSISFMFPFWVRMKYPREVL